MKVIIRNNTVWLLRTVVLISEHVPSVENNPILFPVLFRYFHNIPEISHKNRERLRSLMYNHSSWQSMVSRPWNILSLPVFLFWKWKHKASFRTRLGFIFCNSPCRKEQPFLSTCERRYSRTKKKEKLFKFQDNYMPSGSRVVAVFQSLRLSHVWLLVTPWTIACQALLSSTVSRSLPVGPRPIYPDSWAWDSRFLCNIVLYSIRLYVHHHTQPQLSTVSALAQPLHGSEPCHGKGACIIQWGNEPSRAGPPKMDRP